MSATPKQKKMFKKTIENLEVEKPRPLGVLAVESGYSPGISKQPSRIINSQGFQELLSKIDDNAILNRITEILQDEDKRSSLTAADMLLKLKKRYPDQNSRAVGLLGVLGELTKKENEKDLIDEL